MLFFEHHARKSIAHYHAQSSEQRMLILQSRASTCQACRIQKICQNDLKSLCSIYFIFYQARHFTYIFERSLDIAYYSRLIGDFFVILCDYQH
jgi:hypothetical protein